MFCRSNWNQLKNFHQIAYEHYANGPIFCRKVWSTKLVTSCTHEKLRCDIRASMQVIQLLSENALFKIRYLLTTIHIPMCSCFQFTSSNGALQLIWPPCYLTCTIRMEHITVQDVWKSENTLAKFKIRRCEASRLYIKTFMYLLVQC